MSDWFLGEIRAFAIAWPPQGWALCDGAELKVAQNAALNALIGNTFGGDGKTVFNLPDLRGSTPVGISATDPVYKWGAKGGVETVALTAAQIAPHMHSVYAMAEPGTFALPTGNFISSAGTNVQVQTAPKLFATPASAASMIPLNAGSLSTPGAAAGHANTQPSAVLNYCIAITGLFPPRN